jgi:hypothetical protein
MPIQGNRYKRIKHLRKIELQMKTRLFVTFAYIFLYSSLSVSCLEAQSYRSSLEIAPTDVYKTVFDYIEKRDYERIGVALSYVSPVLDTIKNKFGVDLKPEIETALNKKDSPSLIASIRKLTFYDLKDILNAIVNEGEFQTVDKLQAWIKMAYLDYLFLSPVIVAEKKGFAADQEIKRIFKKAHGALSGDSPYTLEGKGVDPKLFAEYTDQIEAMVLQLFPEFKSVAAGKKSMEP